jgi:hypothetical protein
MPTNVISLKTQPRAVNACVKRSSQRSFNVYKAASKFRLSFEVQALTVIVDLISEKNVSV